MDSWGPFPKSTFFFGFFPGLLKTAVIASAMLGGTNNPSTFPHRERPSFDSLHGVCTFVLTKYSKVIESMSKLCDSDASVRKFQKTLTACVRNCKHAGSPRSRNQYIYRL